MRCIWCGGDKEIPGPGGLRYCSRSCERAAELHAIEVIEAKLNGDPLPTKQEIEARLRAAERWTPEKMQQRIDEFRGNHQ